MKYKVAKKISIVLFFLLLHTSCRSRIINQQKDSSSPLGSGEEIINAMIGIAKSRSCEDVFKGATTYDYCIYLIQPYFDRLLIDEKREVAFAFLTYGKLQNSSLLVFYELISPCKEDISEYLESISDKKLKEEFYLSKKQIFQYRENVRLLSEVNLTRDSNSTGLPATSCKEEETKTKNR